MKLKLTNRENEIIKLICNGSTNSEIAELLFITTHTVKKHIDSIVRKLGAKNRANAAYLYAKKYE